MQLRGRRNRNRGLVIELKKIKNSVKFFNQVIEKNLKVMDMTAFTLSHENNLPIIVFDMNKEHNLLKLVQGEKVGTLIK